MTTDSTDQQLESLLQDGHSIYDFISSKDLPAIRSILTPLTLHDRQTIVYQKINNRTLLYHACYLGFSDIAKYLIDECGADLEEGYYSDSVSIAPMQAALKKFNFGVINLLLKRCIFSTNPRSEFILEDYSLKYNYQSISLMLKLYRKKFNKPTDIIPMERRRDYHSVMIFPFLSEIGFRRSTNFLSFSIHGNIEKIKEFLKLGAEYNFTNSVEEDALYAAILSRQKETVNFFLNYRLYSIKSYVLALEFCGALFIVFRSEKHEGLSCWKESLRIRKKYSIGFDDKRLIRLDTDLGFEFETEEEIDSFQTGYQVYLQSLIIFRRHLSRFSQIVQNAFVRVANHSIFEEDLLVPLQILGEMYEFPSENYSPNTPSEEAIDTLTTLYNNCFYVDDTEESSLSSLEKLFNFLNPDIWEKLLRGGSEFYRIAYNIILNVAVGKIYILGNYNLSEEKTEWIQSGFKKIAEMHSYPYPTTIMHKAVDGAFPFNDVSFLLTCSADPNCVDAFENTPLHLVALLSSIYPDFSRLTHLLLRAGAHIDSVNIYGDRPLDALMEKGAIQYPLKFLSLQCFAAKVIVRHSIRIPKTGYPEVLIKFIRMHSVLPS